MIPMMKTNTFGTQTNSPGRFAAKKTMIYHDEYTPRDEIIDISKLQRDKVKSSQGLHVPKQRKHFESVQMAKSYGLNKSFQERANSSVDSIDIDSQITIPKERFTYKPQMKKYDL